MLIDRSVRPGWYRNGMNYFTVSAYFTGPAYFTGSADPVPAATWTSAVDRPFLIIFDLAMGGGFPGIIGGGPNAATVGAQNMKLDHVAVYRG